LIFVCINAPRAPTTTDAAATNKKNGCQKKRKSLDPNKKKSILKKNAKMPSLTAVAKKNVTGVKIPSYTSGVQA